MTAHTPPPVVADARWTEDARCPICGGYQTGLGAEHCWGFMGANGPYCTNEDSEFFSESAEAWLHEATLNPRSSSNGNGASANGNGTGSHVALPSARLTLADLAQQKHIPREVFEYFGCRETPMGVLIGKKLRWRGRPKYQWVNGNNPTSHPLFPMPGRTMPEEAYFTAGETDALTLRQVGLPAFAITSGEKKGRASLPRDIWTALRKRGLQHAIIGYDGDKHGQEALASEISEAQLAGLQVSVVDLTPYFDPLGAGIKDLNQLWQHLGCDEHAFREALEDLTALRPHRRLQVVFEFPPLERTLADDLAEEDCEVPMAIEQLHPDGTNSLMIAQYTTGKTTVEMNLARSLADDEPFLDAFDVIALVGKTTLAFSNHELTATMRREWMKAMKFKHPERIAPPFDLRGRRFPIWEDEFRKHLSEYLFLKHTKWWIIDPAARAWSGLVTDSNSNDQLDHFLGLLDEVKADAEVTNLLISHHQPRQYFEEGEERGLGAQRFEAWADAIWYLTRDKDGRRTIHARGRDVELDALDLGYDTTDHRVYVTGLTRAQRKVADGVRHAVATCANLLRGGEQPNTTQLDRAMPGDANLHSQWIQEAIAQGYINRTKGKGTAQLHDLTDEGRQLLKTVDLRS